MKFGFIRLFDHILGRVLLLVAVPLCTVVAKFLPKPNTAEPTSITFLKLHGGGSLLIALPALCGIRARYPQARITLIGTMETQKYAELTGIFDHYVLIDSQSLASLVTSGIKALCDAFRHDIFVDFEPHSFLAAVFCPLTFAARRIGFVKADDRLRARSYTDAIYFNLQAPIHVFYEQAAALLSAEPATITECRNNLRAQADTAKPLLPPNQQRPVLYISAFTSHLSPERMMPGPLWVERIRETFGAAPFTVILGGGSPEAMAARDMAVLIKTAMPQASVFNACGTRSLRQAVADIDGADEFWGIDSGPLHIARLLDKKCASFWGPSNPAFRLRAMLGLDEKVFYLALPCSPCVHMAATSPCKGDNQCMKLLFTPDVTAPIIRL